MCITIVFLLTKKCGCCCIQFSVLPISFLVLKYYNLTEVLLHFCRVQEECMHEDIAFTLKLYKADIDNTYDKAMSAGEEEKLVEKFGISITGKDIQSLYGTEWLNDQCILFYMHLIQERNNNNANLPKVHFFHTGFYDHVVKNGYESVRRWTKQHDLFKYDIILVPINLVATKRMEHWTLAVLDNKKHKILYFDSLLKKTRGNKQALVALLGYLKDEHQDKKNVPLLENYEAEIAKEAPQQGNMDDCGVFVCLFAEYYCRNAEMTFSQNDIQMMRRKIVFEIMQECLIHQ